MKEKVYVFGHQNPDTDSVTSAIAVAYLKKCLGIKAEPRILGEINKETKFILKYFNVKQPSYLDNVKLQIKDVDYCKGVYIDENSTIIDAYNYLKEKNITGSPIVDKNKKIKGMITSKDIVAKLIDDSSHVNTSYDNLVRVLKGKKILKNDIEFNGGVFVATLDSDTIVNNYSFNKDTILIVGKRNSIIKHAIENEVKLIILVGNTDIDHSIIEEAERKKLNIISTPYNSFETSRMVILSEYIKNLMNKDKFYKFSEAYNFYDFLKEARKLGHNNYPVVNKYDECIGLIRITEKNEKHLKKVILVDHNESSQSVEGLNEAYIMEVVDHHKIGDLSTNDPINVRNMAVGSTNTIVYRMFKEQNIEIPYEIAGLMLSGILADTLGLKSSTTTELDIITVKKLAQQMNLNYKKYYLEMLKAGTSIDGLTKLEVLTQDYKNFQIDYKKYAIGQTITMDIDNIMKDMDEYLNIMEEKKIKNDLEFILFIATDVIKNGSYIFYTNNCEEMIKECFNLDDVYEGVFIDGMTSRKKQVVPYINEYLK